MTRRLSAASLVLLSLAFAANAQDSRPIWTDSAHAAFTDLARFDGRFVCAFREGERHVHGADGVVRVIASEDGDAWRSVAIVAHEGTDLRDPKLSVTPDGSLMLLAGGSVYRDRVLVRREPRVAFCRDLEAGFGEARPVEIDPALGTPNDWLWRVTWHEGVAWGVVYQVGEDDNTLQLVRSDDGVAYTGVATLDVADRPNETTLRFDAEGRMIALVRREGGDRTGVMGVSSAPYESWEWRSLPVRLGGPDFEVLPDGRLIAGSRRYPSPEDDATRTVLAEFTTSGDWRPLATLPSGGDTSYPGMLLSGETLWVTYYSAHEGKASIYLARLGLDRLWP